MKIFTYSIVSLKNSIITFQWMSWALISVEQKAFHYCITRLMAYFSSTLPLTWENLIGDVLLDHLSHFQVSTLSFSMSSHFHVLLLKSKIPQKLTLSVAFIKISIEIMALKCAWMWSQHTYQNAISCDL